MDAENNNIDANYMRREDAPIGDNTSPTISLTSDPKIDLRPMEANDKAAVALLTSVAQASESKPDEMRKYLFDIIRNHNGWKFVSVSCLKKQPNATGDKEAPLGMIFVHDMMPAIQDTGLYVSPKTKFVESILVKDPDGFQGIIMDRKGNIVVGDYFNPQNNKPRMTDEEIEQANLDNKAAFAETLKEMEEKFNKRDVLEPEVIQAGDLEQ